MTVQVRDLDDDVQQQLRASAARAGMSLSAFLRRELTELAVRLEAEERLDKLGDRSRLGLSPSFFEGISPQEIVQMIREDRYR